MPSITNRVLTPEMYEIMKTNPSQFIKLQFETVPLGDNVSTDKMIELVWKTVGQVDLSRPHASQLSTINMSFLSSIPHPSLLAERIPWGVVEGDIKFQEKGRIWDLRNSVADFWLYLYRMKRLGGNTAKCQKAGVLVSGDFTAEVNEDVPQEVYQRFLKRTGDLYLWLDDERKRVQAIFESKKASEATRAYWEKYQLYLTYWNLALYEVFPITVLELRAMVDSQEQ